ncbi:hypothetical protein KCP77_12595 [Salmonella enterica subsp. enterica]|nr:hypothetical protein KCP77_12595 [Salmonella enterica subsp. enterica]
MGGGAVAGSVVLWNKYKDKVRAAHQYAIRRFARPPLDVRTGATDPALVLLQKRWAY